MKKVFTNIISGFKNDFLGSLLFYLSCFSIFITFLTLPLFTTRSGFSTITNILSIVSCFFIALYLFFRGKIIFNHYVFFTLFFVLYATLITLLFSKSFSTLKSIFTLYSLSLLIFEFGCSTKKIHFLFVSIFAGIILLNLVFFLTYSNQIIDILLNGASSIRLGDEFGNVNYIGRNFAIGSCFCTFYAFKKKGFYFFFLLGTILCTVAIIVTGSRGAFFMNVLAIVVSIFFLFPRKFKWLYFVVLTASGLGIFGLMQLPSLSYLKDAFLKFFNTITNQTGGDVSTRSRMIMITDSLSMWLKNIFFGYGADAFAVYGSFATYSHAALSEILICFGLIGGAAHCLPTLIMVKHCAFKHKRKENFYLPFIITFFISFIVISTVLFVLYLDKITIIVLTMCLTYDFILYENEEKHVSISFFQDKKFHFAFGNYLNQSFPVLKKKNENKQLKNKKKIQRV